MRRVSKLNLLLLTGGVLLLGIGLGVYLLLVFGMITLTPSKAPISLMEGLAAFDTAVGTLLSGGLIYLYLQQQEILDEQRQLQRYELKGELRIEDVDYDNEYLVVKLSNFTRSEITKIQLCTEIFPNKTDDTTFSLGRANLERTDARVPGYNKTNALGSEQRRVEFRVKPRVREQEEGESPMLQELCFLIHRLEEKHGATEFGCRMWVEGEDQIGEKTNDLVFRSDPLVILDRVSSNPDLRGIFKATAFANISEDESQFDSNGI